MKTRNIFIALSCFFLVTQTQAQDPQATEKALISKSLVQTLESTETVAQGVQLGLSCTLGNRGDILRALSRARHMASHNLGPAAEKSFLKLVSGNTATLDVMKNYVGFQLWVRNLAINRDDLPLNVIVPLLEGATFTFGGSSGYSEFQELAFKENGIVEVEVIKNNQILRQAGQWKASVVTQAYRKVVLLEVSAAGITEKLKLAAGMFPYSDSVRILRFDDMKYDDITGFENELRFCLQ